MFSWYFLGGGVLDEQPLAPTILEGCGSSHAPAQLVVEYPFVCGFAPVAQILAVGWSLSLGLVGTR